MKIKNTNKKLKKEIAQLKQLNEILCCALYEKCGSLEEYVNVIDKSINEYKRLHIETMLTRLKKDQESKNKSSQQIGQEDN